GNRIGKSHRILWNLRGTCRDTFPQPYEVSRVTKISRLVELTWAMRMEVFSDSIVTCRSGLVELTEGADLSRWRIFGRKPRCAARNRDGADGNAVCSRSAFRTFPFAAHKHRESNPRSQSASADWISASAGGDSWADHRSFAVV